MELLSIWIEDYMCFKQAALNFNNKYLFEYKFSCADKKTHGKDKRLQLQIKKNDQYIDVFSGYFGSVTAILGKNGSGKTTLTKLLRVIMSDSPLKDIIVIVYKYNGIIYIDRYRGKNSSLEIENTFTFSLKFDESTISDQEKQQFRAIIENTSKDNFEHIMFNALLSDFQLFFYSNCFSDHNDKYIENNSLINCSLDYRLRKTIDEGAVKEYLDNIQKDKYTKYSDESFDILKIYFKNKIKLFFKFLIAIVKPENIKIHDIIKNTIHIPQWISLNVFNNYNKFIDPISQLDEEFINELRLIVKQTLEYIDNNSMDPRVAINEKIKLIIFLSILKNILTDSSISKNENFERRKDIFQLMKQFQLLNSNAYLDRLYSNYPKYCKSSIEKYKILVTSFQSQNFSEMKFLGFSLRYSLQINESAYAIVESMLNLNEQLGFDAVSFSWDYQMSSGEEAMLNQFAEIYSCKDLINRKPTIIVIDEGDHYLHPEWQRIYIKSLFDFLSIVIQEENRNQIIVTSHSPFIISDLPTDNLIFLNRNDEDNAESTGLKQHSKTFGANIHELYTDEFFMKDGLIGEFAKNKIFEILRHIEELPQGSRPDVIIEKQINIIGEPIIQEKLWKLYYSKILPREKNIRKDFLINELKKTED